MFTEPISSDDLRAIDPVSVVHDPNCVDVEAFDAAFLEAAKQADLKADIAAARAFRLLAVLASFHFRPEDKAEPFGNLATFRDGSRTLAGSDFGQSLIEVLAEVIKDIKPLALQVRIADLIWTRDKAKVEFGRQAVAGYNQLVRPILDGTGTLRFEEATATSISVQNFLQRGLGSGLIVAARR